MIATLHSVAVSFFLTIKKITYLFIKLPYAFAPGPSLFRPPLTGCDQAHSSGLGSLDVDIRNSLGAAFVGLIFSTTLFGVAILQTWVYYWNYGGRDPLAVKIFVAFLTVIDTVLAFLRSYALYWYLILNFGNIESLDYIVWALSVQVAVGAVLVVSVQIFYARQIYIMTQNIICPILIGALAAVALSFGILTVVKQFSLKQFSKFDALIWDPCVGIVALALANLLITGAICWALYRKRTGTDSKIMTAVAYIVNSGLLTSILSVGAVIAFAVSPSSLISLPFLWVMGECAVNSLLVLLNSRDYIRASVPESKQGNPRNLTSIRFEPRSEAHDKTGQSASSASADATGTTTSDFVESKTDHNVGISFAVPTKPGTSIVSSHNQSRTSVSSAPGLQQYRGATQGVASEASL